MRNFWRSFDDADIENATEELKSLLQNGFQERLQRLRSLAEVCFCTGRLF
jgi:hypothetical protein